MLLVLPVRTGLTAPTAVMVCRTRLTVRMVLPVGPAVLAGPVLAEPMAQAEATVELEAVAETQVGSI